MPLTKIDTGAIKDDAINSAKIADGTVVASDVLDNTITGAKLASDIAISTSGNITTTGALTSTGIDDNATSTAITIDSSQKVGIGTASPTNELHIETSSSVSQKLKTTSSSNAATLLIDGGASNDSSYRWLGDGTSYYQMYRDGSQSQDLRLYSYTDTAGATDILRYTINGGLRFGTNASERMRITSTGNVGIGTSSPANLLHLISSANSTALQIANTSDTDGIRINSGVSGLSSPSLQFLNVSGDSLLIIDGSNKSTIVGNIGPSGYRASFGDFEVKNLDGSGNPGGTLVLSNTDGSILSSQILGNLTFASYDQSGATTTGGVASIRAVASETYGSTSGASLIFYTHPSSANNGTVDGNMLERMRINNSGNVGIGTGSPSTLLEVQGNSNSSGTANAIRINDAFNGSSFSTTEDFNQLQFSSSDSSSPAGSGVRYSIGVVSSDSTNSYSNLTFRTYDGTEHMRINGSSGNVGIGTSSPGAKLEVISTGTEGNFKLGGYVQTTKAVSLTTSFQDLLQVGNRSSFKITCAVADGSSGGVSGYTIAYVSCSNDYATQGNIDTVGLGSTIVLQWKAASGTSTDSHILQARTTSGTTNQLFVVVETFGGVYASGGSGTGNGQFTFLL